MTNEETSIIFIVRLNRPINKLDDTIVSIFVYFDTDNIDNQRMDNWLFDETYSIFSCTFIQKNEMNLRNDNLFSIQICFCTKLNIKTKYNIVWNFRDNFNYIFECIDNNGVELWWFYMSFNDILCFWPIFMIYFKFSMIIKISWYPSGHESLIDQAADIKKRRHHFYSHLREKATKCDNIWQVHSRQIVLPHILNTKLLISSIYSNQQQCYLADRFCFDEFEFFIFDLSEQRHSNHFILIDIFVNTYAMYIRLSDSALHYCALNH